MKILFRVKPYSAPVKSYYSQSIVGLAEGFATLGIEFFGNHDFWFDVEARNYLIKGAPKDYKPDIEIHSMLYFIEHRNEISFSKRIFILVDDSDGNDDFIEEPGYLKYDLVLKCHYNSIKKYPERIKPWMFGLTNRIIELNRNFAHLNPCRKIIINHRFTHGVRELLSSRVEQKLKPSFEIDKSLTDFLKEETTHEFPHYWAQTGRRHHIEFFRKLNGSILTFCFGGNFQSTILSSRNYWFLSIFEKVSFSRNFIKKYLYVSQFDSFRLWETFSSNSIPLHLDMDYWGMQLPVQPTSGKHYIGVKNLDFRDTADWLNNATNEELESISRQGKEWALENYKPVCQAKYLLSYIN